MPPPLRGKYLKPTFQEKRGQVPWGDPPSPQLPKESRAQTRRNRSVLERRLLANFDWRLLALVIVTAAIGVVLVFSATHKTAQPYLYLTQLLWVGIGLGFLLLILFFDYHFLAQISKYIYGISLLMLIYPLLFGSEVSGARRWIRWGGFSLQPSEVAKIATLLLLAYYYAEMERVVLRFRDVVIPGLIAALPAVLVALQPDLGSALTFVAIYLGVSFVAGARFRAIGQLILILLLIAVVSWFTVLKDYQKERLTTFLKPRLDPADAGYQVRQLKIAVGSGGIWGKGFLHGSQSQLEFVPAQHTDFIFSLLAEEEGFVGTVLMLGLYLGILLRMLKSAKVARDPLGVFITGGFLSLFLFQLSTNICMTVGLMPTSGLPIPLLSYGGSYMIATLAGVGLVLNVRMRRMVN
ncbi:rod shape-determining protein RodA [bacterium (candidate division B38) B3_B38]|nr:MAG: rod shape-determining protein RodA [bacterium (candidate division B38) B3_B38]